MPKPFQPPISTPPSLEVLEEARRRALAPPGFFAAVRAAGRLHAPWVVVNDEYQDALPVGETAIVMSIEADPDTGAGVTTIVDMAGVGARVPYGTYELLPDPREEAELPRCPLAGCPISLRQEFYGGGLSSQRRRIAVVPDDDDFEPPAAEEDDDDVAA